MAGECEQAFADRRDAGVEKARTGCLRIAGVFHGQWVLDFSGKKAQGVFHENGKDAIGIAWGRGMG